MNRRIHETAKWASAIIPQAFTGAATTLNSRAFSLAKERKALFRFRVGNIASTDLVYTLSVLEASDIAGATAQNIGGAATTPAITFTTNADGCVPDANIVQLTMNTVLATEKVTINGEEFEAINGATVLANNQYNMAGTDTQDAAELVSCINNALPKLIASNVGAVITIQSREPGEETITVSGITDVATVIPVTVEVVGYIEIDSSALSIGFDRVLARGLTGGVAAASTICADVLFGSARYIPASQQEAASAFRPVIT